jgi:hypothetical protein
LKKLVLLTAAVAAAVALFVAVTIQPRRLQLPASADGTVAGVIHIHTSRSDGSSGPDDVAVAAARAGLQFVAFTDHGDGTRKPDPPAYRSGVLCLDGVEISTTGGHYIALDMPAAPYPLGGEARDVVEDVKRLGGFGLVAHPDSPKPELHWREWSAPFDAIEVVNPDTGWRVQAQRSGWRSKMRLLAALVDYPFRPAETITGLLSEETLGRWAAIARERRVVTVGGADAHARLALGGGDPGDTRIALPLPGYRPAFQVLSVRVHPDRALSGNASDDAAAILRAMRAGHLHTTIDGIATPGSLTFTATNASGTADQGDELRAHGPVTLHVRTNAPASFTTTVHDGDRIVSRDRHEAAFTVTVSGAPAVYWVETRATGRSAHVAWMRSNPIYVREPASSMPATPSSQAVRRQPIFDGTAAAGWNAENDPTSVAALDVAPAIGGNELRLRFGLSNHVTPPPVVALTYGTPAGLADFDRLAFTARAERPMRVSIQLRAARPERNDWDRWQRSVFIDVADGNRTVAFADFRPVGIDQRSLPPLEAVRSIMFVIDPVNTKRGTSGRFWLRSAVLERIRN